MQFFPLNSPRRRVRLVEVSESFGAVSTFTGVKGQAGLFWGEYLLGPRHLFLSVASTSLTYSSPVPPLPSFVFTLAATGTTGRKS